MNREAESEAEGETSAETGKRDIPLALVGAAGVSAVTGLFVVPYIAGELGAHGFKDGFLSTFLLIFFSEIGDKTFFIAVLLALRQSRGPVFLGTFGALAAMSIVSVALGKTPHRPSNTVRKTYMRHLSNHENVCDTRFRPHSTLSREYPSIRYRPSIR